MSRIITLNSRRLLLSGPSPTPWRSSPAPSLQCSHSLKDGQNRLCYCNILPRAPFSGIADMQKPHQHRCGHSVMVSKRSQHDSVLAPSIDSNMSLLPVTLFLPLWLNRSAYWLTRCKLITPQRLCVHDLLRKERLYIGNCFSGILKMIMIQSLPPRDQYCPQQRSWMNWKNQYW